MPGGPGPLPPSDVTPAGPRADLAASTLADEEAGPASDAPTGLTVVRPLSIQRLAASLGPATPEPAGRPGNTPDRSAAADAGSSLAVQRLPAGGADSLPGEESPGARSAQRAADLEPAWAGPMDALAEPVGRTPIRASSAGSLLDPVPPAGRSRDALVTGREPGGSAQPVVARSLADPLRPSPVVPSSGAGLSGRSVTVQREAVGPLAPRSAAVAPSPAGPLAATGSSASPAGSPTVQRAVEVRELVITTQADNRGPAGEPAGGSTPGSAGAPAPAGAPPSIADRDRELDELARRLYGRIRTKLAAELLADRERAGLLVDLR